MTSGHEMQETVARALCENSTQPCNEHSADAGIAVSALVLAGYLQTGGGAVASGGGSPPSAGAVSTAPSSPTFEPGLEVRTPDEWCRIEGVQILDPDGWRGVNGRPWTDRISLPEFRARLVTCTMRHKTGGGAGDTPPATRAAPLDPAAQADQAIGSPTPSLPFPRRFRLYRHEDPSGVSGTQWVAEGIQFIDGYTALRWFGQHPCTVPWDSIDRIIAVHGHGGLTEIVWLDGAE